MAERLSRPFSVRLPAACLEQLTQLSRLSSRSRNALIAQAVERFVSTEMEFIRASQQATDEALDPAAVLVAHDAVRAWLQAWGTPAEDAAAATLDEYVQRTASRA